MRFDSSFRLPLRSAVVVNLLGVMLLGAFPRQGTGQETGQGVAGLKAVAQTDRISASANFSAVTQLEHQLPGWVQGSQQGAAPAASLGTTLHLSMVLRRDATVQAAFEKLLADQQNARSPLFHKWLTPQQVGQYFGPTTNDLERLEAWLTSEGLKVDSVAPNGVVVNVSGTVAAVSGAFRTSFASFPVGEETRFSAVTEPSIPAALMPLVGSIQGLSEVKLRPMNHARAVRGTRTAGSSAAESAGTRPLFTNNGVYFLMPGDFAVIYDINGVYSGGNKGGTIASKAQHVAVIGESHVTATDVSEFEQIAGLPSVTPTVIVPPGAVDPGTTGDGAQDEATLDVDRVIATAPGAAVDLVVAEDTQTQSGIYEAVAYNVSTLLDPVMSISFGACEAEAGSSNVEAVDAYASTAAAEGITTLVASGDSGAAGCDESFTTAPVKQTAGINFLCSSTFVTCVGGTEFNDTADPSLYWSSTNSATYVSALSYIPEGAWNEPGTDASNYAPAATGGGASLYIAKPSWQTGTGVPADGARDVPDVALSASQHDGYFACLAYAGGDCSQGYFEDFSGTSAAAPGMAGIVALVNTKVGVSAGNINPMLYGLAATQPTAFHDVTVASSGVTGCSSATPSICNNSTPGPTTLTGGFAGFTVGTGYDEATGLGSIDVGQLVANVTAPGVQGTFTLSGSPTTLTVKAGATTANTIAVTGTSVGNFAGTVTLTCLATNASATGVAPTCTVAPASILVTPDGTTTGTVTILSTVATQICAGSVRQESAPWLRGSGGVVLAGLLLMVPFRRRRSMRALALVCVMGLGLAAMSGCGSGGTSICNAVIAGTTTGPYTVTITGTDGTVTASTTVAVTID